MQSAKCKVQSFRNTAAIAPRFGSAVANAAIVAKSREIEFLILIFRSIATIRYIRSDKDKGKDKGKGKGKVRHIRNIATIEHLPQSQPSA